MDNDIVFISSQIWLSENWLLQNGVLKDTIKRAVLREAWECHKLPSGRLFCYDTLPNQTKTKLPSYEALKQLSTSPEQANLYRTFRCSINQGFPRYLQIIEDSYCLANMQNIEFARKAAAIETALDCIAKRKAKLQELFAIVQLVFPGWVSCKFSFANLLTRAKQKGIISVAIDRRKGANGNAKKFGDDVKHKAATYYSSGKAYAATQIMKMLHIDCQVNGWKLPSVRTVRNWCMEFARNTELYAQRYGQEKAKKRLPYVSTIQALNPNDQWQADGMDLPFYTKGEKNFEKLTLFFVVDACSKKIVGYSIDKSENTIMILKAYNDAVSSTNALPYEMVTDNHSYNRTQEGQNFKAETEKLGVHWTVTHNPQHKSIIERLVKKLNDQYFKLHKGYIGQGIKSRERDAHTSPELKDKYQKSCYWLTDDEIRAIAVMVIDDYNRKADKESVSPAQAYQAKEKPHQVNVNLLSRIGLFTKRNDLKVSRGQITIQRAGNKYEYQLPAEFYEQYNTKTVAVHYEDLDSVYLFDIETGQHITTLTQKPKIHGALANQTEADTQLYYKHTGKLKGVKSKAQKTNINRTTNAAATSPTAFEMMNPLTTPKDVLKEAERMFHVKNRMEDLGIDFNKVERSLPVEEYNLESLKTKAFNPKSPYAQHNHTVKIYNGE